jgi:hypothetical protein
MRKFLTICGLISVMLLTALGAVAALPNYSGTWMLVKDKSKGLPTTMEGAGVIDMTVTQDEKTLTVKTSAGGGQEISYNLDGSKSKAQVGGRMPGEATVFLEKKDDGKVVLHSERELNFQGNAVTIKFTEVWELADEGKTLKTKRTIESPRGTQEIEMIFTLKR